MLWSFHAQTGAYLAEGSLGLPLLTVLQHYEHGLMPHDVEWAAYALFYSYLIQVFPALELSE